MHSCLNEKDYQSYLEDLLSKEELHRLKEHLKSCPKCSAEFESWEKVKEALMTTGEVEVPEGFKMKVMEGVRKESILPAAKLIRKSWIVAAAALAVLLGYFLMPVFIPFASVMFNDMVAYLSQLLYQALYFIGLDMKTFVAFCKVAYQLFQNYFWVFALSTTLLIVGFFSLILKGKAQLKSN